MVINMSKNAIHMYMQKKKHKWDEIYGICHVCRSNYYCYHHSYMQKNVNFAWIHNHTGKEKKNKEWWSNNTDIEKLMTSIYILSFWSKLSLIHTGKYGSVDNLINRSYSWTSCPRIYSYILILISVSFI